MGKFYIEPRVDVSIKASPIAPLPSGSGIVGVIGTSSKVPQENFLKKLTKNELSSIDHNTDITYVKTAYPEYKKNLEAILDALEDKKEEYEKEQKKPGKTEKASDETKETSGETAEKPDKKVETPDEKIKNIDQKISEILFREACSQLTNGSFDSFSSYLKVYTTITEYKSNSTNNTNQIVLEHVKQVFQNGASSVRTLIVNDNAIDDNVIELFRNTFPEIDLVFMSTETNSTRLESYVKQSRQEGVPCIGFIGTAVAQNINEQTDIVYVTPANTIAAVAGTVASLDYYMPATYKSVTFSNLPFTSREDMRKSLKQGILPVANVPGRGQVIVKGITSKKEEISVRRIAHYVARNVKNICMKYLGEINTKDARDALRQKIIEFLKVLVRDRALIALKNEDVKAEPMYYQVDVESQNYEQGIVRVDLKIRPSRAIHYIDVTVQL